MYVDAISIVIMKTNNLILIFWTQENVKKQKNKKTKIWLFHWFSQL
jgi:hypothetical protein